MNKTLSKAIERLLAADAEYKQFVCTTRSYELACQGARDSVLAAAAAELAFKEYSTPQE